ncbi:substrate-binding domain-containing protein [Roseomonas sp. E05]|uniref:substrate-binding domain-containing protein n=1 Tax=Roseomonas sp. E05 TaxID=3046310 RepID=UPI0024BB1CAF|nr:substrate-binding domain-containing protein [Roseomonas sp. E05]MDJ0391021.1 substrate-binding domain-containing protein [Roseomonas sp. E05]
MLGAAALGGCGAGAAPRSHERAAPPAPAGIPAPWRAEPQPGRAFAVPELDIALGLLGDVADPQLVVFYGGKQFMAVPDLLRAFRAAHPCYERIFVETLPPGVLGDQIEQSALVVGNLRIAHRADVFVAGRSRIERMQREAAGRRFAATRAINRNRLTLMVREDNPAGLRAIEDLGQPHLRVAMPNPAWEGIGRQVEEVLRQAGGGALHRRVMREKAADGSTVLTDIHHRQTPMRLLRGQSDVGPVWETEVLHQRRLGQPITGVEIPEPLNRTGTTLAAALVVRL